MAIYERFSGGFVSDRVRPVPGSEEAEELAKLAKEEDSGWRCVEPDPEPEPEPTDPPGGGGGGSGPEDTKPPARSALKDDWVAYARAVEEDPDRQAAIDGLTKDELIERYGGES